MSGSKRALVDAVPDDLSTLATQANLRYGTAIHQRGGVELIASDRYRATAWVGGLDGSVSAGGGQRRRTRLSSTTRGLSWHCAGNPKDHDIFCKHCVALALAIQERASNGRSVRSAP